MAQNIYLLPWHMKPALKLVRPVIVDGPIVATGDRFLVIGTKHDMMAREYSLTAESVNFDPAVVVGLIIRELWDVDLASPLRQVKRELWEVDLDNPVSLAHRELWEVDLDDPTTQEIRELWEN